MLPRIIGQGRASELLYTGRVMTADEGRDWGFFNGLAEPGEVLEKALNSAQRLAKGPTFAHGVTKKCLHQEWNVSIEQALEIEAEAVLTTRLSPRKNPYSRAIERLAPARRCLCRKTLR
jgi:enoyl-CoA hydratase/carnithine racemase